MNGDFGILAKAIAQVIAQIFDPLLDPLRTNGKMEILMKGNDGRDLAAEFEVNARHTLEFMASNQMATAQKVIWEQFPEPAFRLHPTNTKTLQVNDLCRPAQKK